MNFTSMPEFVRHALPDGGTLKDPELIKVCTSIIEDLQAQKVIYLHW